MTKGLYDQSDGSVWLHSPLWYGCAKRRPGQAVRAGRTVSPPIRYTNEFPSCFGFPIGIANGKRWCGVRAAGRDMKSGSTTQTPPRAEDSRPASPSFSARLTDPQAALRTARAGAPRRAMARKCTGSGCAQQASIPIKKAAPPASILSRQLNSNHAKCPTQQKFQKPDASDWQGSAARSFSHLHCLRT